MKIKNFLQDAKGVSKVLISGVNDDVNVYWRWNNKRGFTLLVFSCSMGIMLTAMYFMRLYHIGVFA